MGLACSNRETSVARLEGAKERETEAETRKGAGASRGGGGGSLGFCIWIVGLWTLL